MGFPAALAFTDRKKGKHVSAFACYVRSLKSGSLPTACHDHLQKLKDKPQKESKQEWKARYHSHYLP